MTHLLLPTLIACSFHRVSLPVILLIVPRSRDLRGLDAARRAVELGRGSIALAALLAVGSRLGKVGLVCGLISPTRCWAGGGSRGRCQTCWKALLQIRQMPNLAVEVLSGVETC
jgi:hypothetical protein